MYKEYARLRDARGITDYKVAKDTGISTATLSNWKNGAYRPKVDKLAILAEYFDVQVEDLIKSKSIESEKGDNK